MKIAINGAGIAGPTLAYWLERQGHEVLMIEQSPAPRSGGYIVDFWGVGYEVADRMGLRAAVDEAGYRVRKVRLVGADGHRVGGFSTAVFRNATRDRFTSLPRSALARILYDHVASRIETLFGDSIAAVSEEQDGLQITLERGGEREVDLLIGADGLHSRVRALVFGPEQSFERFLGYHVAAFELPDYRPRDELADVSHSRPGRQVARFAQRDGSTLLFFVFAEERRAGPAPVDAASRKAALTASYADVGWECPSILERMQALPDIYFDRVSQIRMDRWSQGRVMLIGDAAACVSLMAGEGAGLAMTEGYVLAHALSENGGNHVAGFAASERRLRPLVERKQKGAAKFASAFAPKTAFGLWFRNRVTHLLAVPWLADLLVGRDLRDDFELPRME